MKAALTFLSVAVSVSAVKHAPTPANTPGYLPIEQTLRVCNAYPYDVPLNVFLNEQAFYNGLKFNSCMDFENVGLRPGDLLKFRTEIDHETVTAGVFEFADLPPFSGTLLLVVKRHDSTLNAVSFDSHVFRVDDHAAQVAMIDTYSGVHNPTLRIMRHERSPETAPERLKWKSVHKVNSGWYDVAVELLGGGVKETPFVALPHKSYVVLRTGMAQSKFTENVVIFPQDTVDELNLDTGACEGQVLKPFWKIFGYCHDP